MIMSSRHARVTVPDPSSCARFLSCEAGSVKLEECPDGLHYMHRYCTVLYCTVPYCTVLYCTVLYCTVLYCTVL